jgi:hypothetical protein
MFKVLVPIAAVAIGAGWFFGDTTVTLVVCGVVVVAGFAIWWWGTRANYKHPTWASRAIEGWSVAWIVVLGLVCVVGAFAGVRIKDASPDSASSSTKAVAALAAAALAAILGWLLEGKPEWSSGGVTKSRLKDKFTTLFPSQPQAPAEGIAAWKAVDQAVFHTDDTWNIGFRATLFEVVQQAVNVDGYKGGTAWVDAVPPGPPPGG